MSKEARGVSGLSGREVPEQICGEKAREKLRVRQPDSGRRSYKETWGPSLDEQFLDVLRHYTAGDPMDEKVRWTNLTLGEMVAALREAHHIRVSPWVVRKLLKKHSYRRRKAQKKTTMKDEIKHRNAQFENITQLKADYEAASGVKLPVVSDLLGEITIDAVRQRHNTRYGWVVNRYTYTRSS